MGCRFQTTAGIITNTFVYDDAGRMAGEDLTVNFGTERTYSHGYLYDDANRLREQTYPDGSVVNRGYTERHQLNDVDYTGVGSATSSVLDMVYDAGMRETKRTFGNGIVTTRAYDRSDNLVTKIDTSGYLGLTFTYGTAGYDDNKNPLLETTGGVMTNYSWTTAGGSTANYDEEDRLTYWKRTSGSVSREWPTGANTGLTDVGDWDSVKIDGVTQTRTHGSAHELTAIGANPITLDAKGNITADATKTTTHNYTWDFDNRMRYADVDGTAGNEIEYTYDALGRRVSKTVPVAGGGGSPTTTVYTCMTRGLAESPHAGQVSSEFAANSAATSPLRKYIYGTYIDEPLLLVDLTGADGDATGDNTAGEDYYFYHTNRQFCVTALTDSSAAVVERYAYTPYGQTVILAPDGTTPRTTSSFSNPYQYTGRRSDEETGLYHYRARPYDVDLSRFLNRDPSLYKGSPWNLYEYVSGGSLAHLDPTGLGAPTVKYRQPWDWYKTTCRVAVDTPTGNGAYLEASYEARGGWATGIDPTNATVLPGNLFRDDLPTGHILCRRQRDTTLTLKCPCKEPYFGGATEKVYRGVAGVEREWLILDVLAPGTAGGKLKDINLTPNSIDIPYLPLSIAPSLMSITGGTKGGADTVCWRNRRDPKWGSRTFFLR